MAGFKQTLGNFVDTVGTKFKLPEYKLSERIAGASTNNTGVTPQSRQVYTGPVSKYQAPSGGNYANNAQNLGSILSTSDVRPSTGGQSAGGGGGGTGGTGAGINLQSPDFSNTQDQGAFLSQLRSAYGQTRDAISAQEPLLDQTYNLAKGDIEAENAATMKRGEEQKAGLEKTFGGLLKTANQTYQDLNRSRQGTFSALGTLDSSAFQEQQLRGDQNFGQQVNEIGTTKVQNMKSVDDQVNEYVQKGKSELGRLGIEYQRGKNALRSALAQANLDEAGAIQGALDQMRARAQEVQNSMIGFANQAALLKAQGMDVRTNLGQVTGNDYASSMTSALNQQLASGKNMYGLPQGGVQGQGYISPSNKAKSEEEQMRLLGMI